MVFENERCLSCKGTRKHLSQKCSGRNCFWQRRVVAYQYFVVKMNYYDTKKACVYNACFLAYFSHAAPTAVLRLWGVWYYVQHLHIKVRLKRMGTLTITWQEENG